MPPKPRLPRSKSEPVNRIITLGEIDNESACDVISIIHEINYEDRNKEEDKREPIQLILVSPGGEVYEGMGIIDTIDHSITPVHIYVYGLAMSMAFAITTCGHYRYASKRTTFMYHEISWNTAQEKMRYHEQELIEGKRTWKMYDDIVSKYTNIPLKTLTDIREKQKEWYITADEALKLGIIDEIL
jgi:ATP-dependent Clp protease protease subunit